MRHAEFNGLIQVLAGRMFFLQAYEHLGALYIEFAGLGLQGDERIVIGTGENVKFQRRFDSYKSAPRTNNLSVFHGHDFICNSLQQCSVMTGQYYELSLFF